jgi:hypothetical protein
MSIDERLEALTQSVELLAQMHRDFEANAAKRDAETAERMATMMQAITRLAHIAAVHDTELDDHGKRLNDLETQ